MDKQLDHLFVLADRPDTKSEVITAPNYSYWRSVLRSFFSKKSNYFMLALLIIILIMSYIQPIFSGFEALLRNHQAADMLNPQNWFLKPSWAHPFGTTSVGVDLFDYIWAGTKTSLSIALIASAINITIGIAVGAAWGYSKAIDKVMTEVYNVISNVPFILFVTIFMYIVGPGFWSLIGAMTITGWVGVAYFIRRQVIIIRDREYNLASRCIGTPLLRMLTKNILPYMTSVIVTLAANEIPSYISYEVFLSYIGVGIGAENASLGRMIQENVQYMVVAGRSHVFWIPVAVAALVTISLYVVGQNLADSSDPRTHM
jgi:oligopeptide transport system permease protein